MPDSAAALSLIIALLPGFVGYLVFSNLYDRPPKENFEKSAYVVLIGCISIGLLTAIKNVFNYDTDLSVVPDLSNAISLGFLYQNLIAIFVGVIFGSIGNSKWFAKFAKWSHLSNKAGHSAVLAATIRRHPDSFLRFRLKGGGYILGHPIFYSIDGEECCVFLEKAARRSAKVGPRSKVPTQVDINGPGVVIVNFDEVLFIEIV